MAAQESASTGSAASITSNGAIATDAVIAQSQQSAEPGLDMEPELASETESAPDLATASTPAQEPVEAPEPDAAEALAPTAPRTSIALGTTTVVDTRFVAGGKVESEVWALWDTSQRARMQTMIQDRMIKQGDVYALYDFQSQMHNLVSMARRANRTTRLLEIARIMRPAYTKLTPTSIGRQWLCQGGTFCTQYSYIGKEVRLNSAQFLALAVSVASGLASSTTPLSSEAKLFITDTMAIAAEHLIRWGDDAAISKILSLSTVTADSIKTATTSYGFTDYHLWQITMYAELAKLRQWHRGQGLTESTLITNNQTRMRNHVSALLKLYLARISYQQKATGSLPNVNLATLDRGYWKRVIDFQYAGYEGTQAPVVCSPTKAIKVPLSSVTMRNDITWDLSHGRRLVHALDSLEANRAALKSIYALSDTQLGSTGIGKAFAASMVATIWNQSTTQPLFRNNMSGANGWYHAKYNSSTGSCFEGHAPYKLSDSFVTGGYITWSKYYPIIGTLGQKLYDMKGQTSTFMTNYYFNLSASGTSPKTTGLMFLPTLVAN